MHVYMHRGCVNYKEDPLSGSTCLALLCQCCVLCDVCGFKHNIETECLHWSLEVYSRQTHGNKQEIAHRFIREVWGVCSLSLAKWEDGNVTRWNYGTIGKKKTKLLFLTFAHSLTSTKKRYAKVQRHCIRFKDNKLRFRHSAVCEWLGQLCAKIMPPSKNKTGKLKQHKCFKVKGKHPFRWKNLLNRLINALFCYQTLHTITGNELTEGHSFN